MLFRISIFIPANSMIRPSGNFPFSCESPLKRLALGRKISGFLEILRSGADFEARAIAAKAGGHRNIAARFHIVISSDNQRPEFISGEHDARG